MTHTRDMEREQRILAMREQGMSTREIGREFGISGERVRQILERNGMTGYAFRQCPECGRSFPRHAGGVYCGRSCYGKQYRRLHGISTLEERRAKERARIEARNAELARLRQSGLTCQQIAERVGMHPVHVSEVLRHIAPIHRTHAIVTPEVVAAMQAERDAGVPVADIAANHGAHINTVYKRTTARRHA